MARVSLIVLRSAETAWPSARIASCRAALGPGVEVLAVGDPLRQPTAEDLGPGCRSIVADGPGLAEGAIAGLRAARGKALVVLDVAMEYSAEEVAAVAGRLEQGDADLVVASRRGRWTGPIARRFLGVTDPASGLIGVTRGAAEAADESFAPVGSRFALELLARVGGKRVDVPVGRVARGSGPSTPLDDLRQVKRLADDRFGNGSRLLQFCFVGASGMAVDLSCYAALQAAFARAPMLDGVTTPGVGGPLSLALAAIISISVALTWNFTINRRLTFNDSRGGSIGRQYLRYVLSNLLGIAVSLTLRLLLPASLGFFRDHRLAAALVGIVAATGISFSMARWFVFGREASPAGEPSASGPRRDVAGLQARPRAGRPRAATRGPSATRR